MGLFQLRGTGRTVCRIACLLAAATFAGVAQAQLPVEHITVETLPPANGHRLYVLDGSLAHGVDGKVHVMDGDTLQVLGQFSNGFFGDFVVSASGGTLYNATTFFSRGDHGTHTEVLEYYDPKTLTPAGEVTLPPKRAQSNGVSALMAESAGGNFLFIQNATPAQSVTIVDSRARKVIAELPIAGCYGIYPSAATPGRFSSLCGDGSVLTVDFAADGKETGRHSSKPFFDAQNDPLFLPAATLDAHSTVFVSFLGHVHVIDVSGETATEEAPWSILAGVSDSAGWRPGGTQVIAVNRAAGMLYVAMHPNGKEGSHKDPAAEIWKVDLRRKSVVARGKTDGAVCVEVSQDSHPMLITESGLDGSISRYDGDTLAKLGQTAPHLLDFGGPLWLR